LHRIENADNAAPTFATIVRLSRVLGVSLHWLASVESSDLEEPRPPDGIVLDDETRRSLATAAHNILDVLGSQRNGVEQRPKASKTSQREPLQG
jgi:hypothetical protein